MGPNPQDFYSKYHYNYPPSINTTNFIYQDILDYHIDSIFVIGDISYAVGFESEHEWYLDQVEKIASLIPFNVGYGNHEYDFNNTSSKPFFPTNDSGGEGGICTKKLYQINDYYSYNIGNIHIIMMNTEIYYDYDSLQYKWLEHDLKQANLNSDIQWIIVGGHRPMYVNSIQYTKYGDNPIAKLMRTYLEPLFIKYNVTLCFWGHHHAYSRTSAVNNEQIIQKSKACGINNQARCFYNIENSLISLVVGTAGAEYSDNLKKHQLILNNHY